MMTSTNINCWEAEGNKADPPLPPATRGRHPRILEQVTAVPPGDRHTLTTCFLYKKQVHFFFGPPIHRSNTRTTSLTPTESPPFRTQQQQQKNEHPSTYSAATAGRFCNQSTGVLTASLVARINTPPGGGGLVRQYFRFNSMQKWHQQNKNGKPFSPKEERLGRKTI